MMINRNIWTIAVWLVAKHGTSASTVVTARISRLRDGPVEKSAITSWLMVDHAVHELTRPLSEGERVN
jgi:hypothetical protein